jgi:serine/threonine-protein kinase
MSDLSGQTIGPYHILGLIGHGGMADVYRALQTNIEREVAIKVLPATFLQDRSFLDRFKREVKIIAQLQSPRILPVYDYGEHNGQPYIVMAYLTGGTLTQQIKASRGGLPLDEVVRLVGQMAEGLDFAHEKGIVHRDFKPSNVLLDEKGNAHLADFGIAKATAETAQLTGSGMIGTPTYMAPEMSQPGGITSLVDIYALGVTVYQMLAGQSPFRADTPMGMMMAHVNLPVPGVRELRPDLPDGVQAVIEGAMAKDPNQRTPRAGEVARRLQAAASGEMSAPRPKRPAAMPRGIGAPAVSVVMQARPRTPAWIWAVGAAVVLGVTALAVLGAGGGSGGGVSTPTSASQATANVTGQAIDGLVKTITAQAQVIAGPGATATSAPTDTPSATVTPIPAAVSQPPAATPASTRTKAPTPIGGTPQDTPATTRTQAPSTSAPTASPKATSGTAACPFACPAGFSQSQCHEGNVTCTAALGPCVTAQTCVAQCIITYGSLTEEVQCAGKQDENGNVVNGTCICITTVP